MVDKKEAGISAEKTMMLDPHKDKPQIDLNEFLQQMGILKKNDQQEEEEEEGETNNPEERSLECSFQDFDREVTFEEKTFSWDTYMDMQGYEEKHEGGTSAYQSYDIIDDFTMPSTIWDFSEE